MALAAGSAGADSVDKAASRLLPLDRSSLRARVVDTIRNAIVQGRLRPGDKIPEVELAEQLGVSRTPIREAIRILEQQGLVATRPKNGTYIARLDPDEARDSLLVRAALEELAVRQALERSSSEEWDAICASLDEIVQGMEAALERGDQVAAIELDTRFHTVLIESAGNVYLSRTWSAVGLPFLIWAPERELYPLAEAASSVGFTERHRELVAFFRRRNLDESAQAIRSHILRKLADVGANAVDAERRQQHEEEE